MRNCEKAKSECGTHVHVFHHAVIDILIVALWRRRQAISKWCLTASLELVPDEGERINSALVEICSTSIRRSDSSKSANLITA